MGLPIVLLMCRDLTFCQFFLSSETRKLMPGSKGEYEHLSYVYKNTRRTQHDIAENLVISHLDVADGDTQAKDLLQLELDSRADLSQLVVQVLSMGHRSRELASCKQVSPTERTRASKSYPSRDRARGDEESA